MRTALWDEIAALRAKYQSHETLQEQIQIALARFRRAVMLTIRLHALGFGVPLAILKRAGLRTTGLLVLGLGLMYFPLPGQECHCVGGLVAKARVPVQKIMGAKIDVLLNGAPNDPQAIEATVPPISISSGQASPAANAKVDTNSQKTSILAVQTQAYGII